VTAAGALGDTVRYTAFLAALAGIYIGVDEGIAATVGKERCVLHLQCYTCCCSLCACFLYCSNQLVVWRSQHLWSGSSAAEAIKLID
jgi:hypothetical protein